MRACSSPVRAAVTLLAVAAAVLLWAPRAVALEALIPNDQNYQNHHATHLPVPGGLTEPLRLNEFPVGPCIAHLDGSRVATCLALPDPFSLTSGSLTLKTDGTLHLTGGLLGVSGTGGIIADAPLTFSGLHLQLTVDGTSLGLSGATLQRLALAFTGDATGTMAAGAASAALTIPSNTVTFAKTQTIPALSVVANPTGSTANESTVACSADGQFVGRAGGTLVCTSTVAATSAPLASGAVGFGSSSNLLAGDAAHFSWDRTNFRIGSRVPGAAPLFQLHLVDEAGASDRGLTVETYVAGTSGPLLNLDAAQGSYASPAAVDATKYGGRLAWRFHDGTSFDETGKIFAHVTPGATVATGSVPTDVAIQATATGGALVDAYVAGGTRVGLLLRGTQVGFAVNPVGAALPAFANVFGSVSTVFGSNSGSAVYVPGNFGSTGIHDNNGQLVLMLNNSFSPGPSSTLLRLARSLGTNASPTAVTAGTELGGMSFSGYDGSSYAIGSTVMSFVDFNSSVSAGSVPANWGVFSLDGQGLPGLFHGFRDDVVAGNWSQLATSATQGFFWAASVPGVPTGSPVIPQISSAIGATTTAVPLVPDAVDARLYARFGGRWSPIAQDTTAMSTGFLRNTTSTGVWSVDTTTYAPTTRTLTAGLGLTGGGTLAADRTFDVGANADGSIAVNANDIQVGVLATDTQHGARGGGTQHAVATPSVAGFESAADKTKLDGIAAGATAGITQLTGVLLAGPGSGSQAGTIAANGVTNAMIRQSAAGTIVGRSTGTGTGNVSDQTVLEPMELVTGNLALHYDASTLTLSGGTTLVRGPLTGDVTASAGFTGTTLTANVVSDAKFRQSGALSVVGRSANSTGNTADISATAASGAVLRESGSTIGFGNITEGVVTNLTTDLAGKQATGNYVTSGTGPVTFSGPGAAATSINLGGGSISGTLALANEGAPTGTGFPHVTSGAWDGAARAVSLATGDVTGLLPLGNLALCSTGQVVGMVGGVEGCVTPTAGTVYTGTSPIVVSGSAISCPTCGTGTGSGSVTVVTGTAPIVITSTPTTTPNVTLSTDATLAVVSSNLGRAAISGDGSIPAGTNVFALSNIPSGTTAAGFIDFAQIGPPATPVSGHGRIYEDNVSANFAYKNAAATVSHMVQTISPIGSQFLTGINDAGISSRAQPVESDIVNLVSDLAGKQAVLTFPAAGQVFVSAGPGSNPVGDSNFTFDTSTHTLTSALHTVLGGSVQLTGAAGSGEVLLGVGNTGFVELGFPGAGLSFAGGVLSLVPDGNPFHYEVTYGGPNFISDLPPNAFTGANPDFWLRPDSGFNASVGGPANFAAQGQVWEVDTGGSYTTVSLRAFVYECGITASGVNDFTFTVTKNGVNTGVTIVASCPNSIAFNTDYSASGSVAFGPTDRVGIRGTVTNTGSYNSGVLRATAHLRLSP